MVYTLVCTIKHPWVGTLADALLGGLDEGPNVLLLSGFSREERRGSAIDLSCLCTDWFKQACERSRIAHTQAIIALNAVA